MDTDPAEDIADILRKASAGDEGAWRSVIDRYASRVFGLLRAQCNDPELAEELTQSTFCTVAAKIGTDYTEYGRFESWLFRIAMNRLRDEMRRRKRQARPTSNESMAAFVRDAERPESLFDGDDVALLNKALSQLAPAEREIIDLRHIGGLSFRQLETLLEEPLGTLLARHHRALRKLRDLIKSPKNPPEGP